MTNDRLHNIREAATRLAISPWSVRRLAARGALRVVRVGRRILVAESEILHIIKNGCGRQRRRIG